MKRIVKWLIPCLVACFMVFGLVQNQGFIFAEDQDDSVSEGSNAPVPTHEKSISGDEANGYTITLNVKGQKETIPGQKPMVDVILVIDQSGSMDNDNSYDMTDPDTGATVTRMAALQKIVTGSNGLSKTILGNNNLDARMAIVTYSGSQAKSSDWYATLLKPSEIGDKDSAYNDAVIKSSWVGNYSGDTFVGDSAIASINSSVNDIDGEGGTNCEAGLVTASEVFSTSRSDAQKYLIFLSDGEPTYYYANGRDYCKNDVIELSFQEQNHYGNVGDPNGEEIQPETYGEHINYEFNYRTRQWEWKSIKETDYGWHYITDENNESKWVYGLYQPTKYGDKTYDAGITLGLGSEDLDSTEIPVPEGDNHRGICSERAKKAVTNYINRYNLDGFYTVGVAKNFDETFLKELKNQSTANKKEYFNGSDTTLLKKAFTDIANSILDSSLTVSNVTITDQLSDYVNLSTSIVDGKETIATVLITDASGNDVTSTENVQAGMSVSFSGNTVTCDFNDGYSLKENYTYSVSFNVVPSQKAYTEYSKNNGSYGVDKDGNALTGFKSNGSAQLTYTYGDSESSETRTVSYDQKPEIQVSANQLTVTKVVEGKLANKNDEFTFNVDLINNSETLEGNYSFGSVEIKDKEGNNVSDSTISNQNGNITFKLKDGQTAYLTNLPRNYTFTLEEEPADGYDTTYSTQIVDTKNNAQSATFTYENKDKIFITVTNTAKDIAITGITDNTPKGLGLIGSIVVEIAAIAFVLKKKRQLKM